ncbi:neurotransmitter:sodium symporter [Aureococcus anophagefferens]|nr:neurotransmitter:sodium symporter [Aureococcus anophagefferens]
MDYMPDPSAPPPPPPRQQSPRSDATLTGATPPPKRSKWNSRTEFLLATVGNCVGVGNVWRFPYLCYRNGGGSFLVPYFLALLLLGMPLFLLELALGQRFELGATHAYGKLHRRFRGVGAAGTLMAYVCLWYYNVILAWTVVYAAHSLRPRVPWGADGVDAERFWEAQVLHESSGFDDFGERGPASAALFFALVLSWTCLFLATRRGVHSAGKVAYVAATAPYGILVLLVIRGLTLRGAAEGLKFYVRPDARKLATPRPWLDAANQIVYSLGVGTGQMIAFGSYNPADEDVVADSLAIAGAGKECDIPKAPLGRFPLARRDGADVGDVVASGEGLAFVAYPDGLSSLPAAGLWSFLFFVMLFALCLDSGMAMLECWTTMLRDFGVFSHDAEERWTVLGRRPRSQDVVVGGSCLFGFCGSLLFITRPGIYWFALVDRYVIWGTPAFCVLLAGASFQSAFADSTYEGARSTASAKAIGFLLMVGPACLMAGGAFERPSPSYCAVEKPAASVELTAVAAASPTKGGGRLARAASGAEFV